MPGQVIEGHGLPGTLLGRPQLVRTELVTSSSGRAAGPPARLGEDPAAAAAEGSSAAPCRARGRTGRRSRRRAGGRPERRDQLGGRHPQPHADRVAHQSMAGAQERRQATRSPHRSHPRQGQRRHQACRHRCRALPRPAHPGRPGSGSGGGRRRGSPPGAGPPPSPRLARRAGRLRDHPVRAGLHPDLVDPMDIGHLLPPSAASRSTRSYIEHTSDRHRQSVPDLTAPHSTKVIRRTPRAEGPQPRGPVGAKDPWKSLRRVVRSGIVRRAACQRQQRNPATGVPARRRTPGDNRDRGARATAWPSARPRARARIQAIRR